LSGKDGQDEFLPGDTSSKEGSRKSTGMQNTGDSRDEPRRDATKRDETPTGGLTNDEERDVEALLGDNVVANLHRFGRYAVLAGIHKFGRERERELRVGMRTRGCTTQKFGSGSGLENWNTTSDPTHQTC
jgi:hypothetical protein